MSRILAVLVLTTLALTPVAARIPERTPTPPSPDYRSILVFWERHGDRDRIDFHRGWVPLARGDQGARKSLVTGGEAAVEAFLDLFVGPANRPLTPKQEKFLARLVAKLGDADYRVREAASRELRGLPRSYDLLHRYFDHPDLEVRHRVRAVIGGLPAEQEVRALRAALLHPATRLFETEWTLAALRNVGRRNLSRLARVEEVNRSSAHRPTSPILAALRHSDDPADRARLGSLARTARPGAARIALGLMRHGLSTRSGDDMAPHWKKVPEHDYTEAALACIDPARPEVLDEAMYAGLTSNDPCRECKALRGRLHTALAASRDERFRAKVYEFLWNWFSDPKACDHYRAFLTDPNFTRFEEAAGTLPFCHYLDQGPMYLDTYRVVLHGPDRARRLVLLEKARYLRGERTVRLVADALAPFLISPDRVERRRAELALRELDEGDRGVLSRIERHGPAEAIRAAARRLRAEAGR